MNFEYVARTDDNRIVRGKFSASSEEAASEVLGYGGLSVLSLKEVVPFFKPGSKLTMSLTPEVKPMEIIMFSRQMALLLESGTDAVTSLELLSSQAENKALKRILAEVVKDVRGGLPLSEAMALHKRVFAPMYSRLVAVGEKTGTLETVLRRAAEYMERSYVTRKSVKNALTYPVVVILVAIAVIAIMVTYVLPAFVGLYSSFSADLPAPTRALLAFTEWTQVYGVYVAITAGVHRRRSVHLYENSIRQARMGQVDADHASHRTYQPAERIVKRLSQSVSIVRKRAAPTGSDDAHRAGHHKQGNGAGVHRVAAGNDRRRRPVRPDEEKQAFSPADGPDDRSR